MTITITLRFRSVPVAQRPVAGIPAPARPGRAEVAGAGANRASASRASTNRASTNRASTNGGPPVQPAATRTGPALSDPTGAAAAGGGSNALHSLLVLAEPAAMLGADAAGLGLLGQALLAASFRSLRRILAS
jgi:hypothetical protein